MNNKRNKTIKFFGIPILMLGIILLLAVFVLTPNFVEKYISADNDLSPAGINQLNNYRLYTGCIGIIAVISGLIILFAGKFPGKFNTVIQKLGLEKIPTFLYKNNNLVLIIYLFILAVFAGVVMIWITPFGPSTSYDSVKYIEAAKGLRDGLGFSKFSTLTQYPPFYPMVIAFAGFIVTDIVEAARLVEIVFYSLSVLLIAYSIYEFTGKSLINATLVSLFFILTPPLLELYAYAWSESVYIALSLSCILLLTSYFTKPTWLKLIGSSLLLGLSILTRYQGFAFLPFAMIIIYLTHRKELLWKRLEKTIIWSIVAIGPIAIYFISVFDSTESAVDLDITMHVMPILDFLSQATINLINLLIPFELSKRFALIIFIVLSILFIIVIILLIKMGYFQKIKSHHTFFPIICFAYALANLTIIYITLSIFDLGFQYDTEYLFSVQYRYFVPSALTFLIGSIVLLFIVSNTKNKKILWYWGLIFLTLCILVNVPNTINRINYLNKNGRGFTSSNWQNSETLAYTKSLPVDSSIRSNGPDLIRLFTDIEPIYGPVKTRSAIQGLDEEYQEELDTICKEINRGETIYIFFNALEDRYMYPKKEEWLSDDCQLEISKEFSDGVVFGQNNN